MREEGWGDGRLLPAPRQQQDNNRSGRQRDAEGGDVGLDARGQDADLAQIAHQPGMEVAAEEFAKAVSAAPALSFGALGLVMAGADRAARSELTRLTPRSREAGLNRSEASGARTTSNADLAGVHNQELAGCKLVRVLFQHGIEVFDFGLQGGSGKPEENDADMGKPLVENQLAEIAVGNQQNPLLFPGDGKDILISKPGRVVAGDG
ncbi:MAG TPA: hypothetical protein VJ770_06260 [Stellaceae bacterium]|nr:hypothetical protein [Stellaceae bacterium]